MSKREMELEIKRLNIFVNLLLESLEPHATAYLAGRVDGNKELKEIDNELNSIRETKKDGE